MIGGGLGRESCIGSRGGRTKEREDHQQPTGINDNDNSIASSSLERTNERTNPGREREKGKHRSPLLSFLCVKALGGPLLTEGGGSYVKAEARRPRERDA